MFNYLINTLKIHNQTRVETLKLNSFGDLLLFTYTSLFTIHTFISLTLQCTYVNLKTTTDMKAFNLDRNVTIMQVQNIMLSVGQIYRLAGTPGISYYSSICFVPITYYFIKMVFDGKVFNYFNNNTLISYLIEPDLENERISKQIEICLHKVINSNINFTRSITNNENDKLNRSDHFNQVNYLSKKSHISENNENFYRLQEQTLAEGAPTSIEIDNLKHRVKSISAAEDKILANYKNDMYQVYERKDFKSNDWIARSTLLNSLAKQLSYLTVLSVFKSRVWPINRNSIWAENIKRFWLNSYIILSVIFWLAGQILIYFINYTSLKPMLLSDNSSSGDNFYHISILDRLSCAESHIHAYFILEWMVIPITIIIIGIKDQMEHLLSLKPKINQVYKRTKGLEKDYYNNGVLIRENFNLLNEQLKNDLLFECDKEAIELYISYQIFREDVQALFEVAKQIINQGVSQGGLILTPLLLFYRGIPDHLVVIFSIAVLSVVIMLNGLFCISAALHTASRQVSKSAWSFVAFAEGHICYRYALLSKQLSILKNVHTNYNETVGFKNFQVIPKNSNKMEVDCEYYYNSSISPHTILLWRRLVKNNEFLDDKLVCKLYGIFQINYSMILRFNYWLISLALFSITFNDNDEKYLKFSKRF